MRICFICILLIVGLAAVCASSPCLKPGTPQANISQLKAGDYSIVFVATKGRWKGKRTSGTLWLREASPDDRSPRTGEIAQDFANRIPPLFGWLDADLSIVGAPIRHDSKVEPSPKSQDPVYPGVLVHFLDWGKDYPHGTPVLTVSTVSNLRNGTNYTDGTGIGLWVHSVTSNGFSGVWREWGMAVGGHGHFCANKIE